MEPDQEHQRENGTSPFSAYSSEIDPSNIFLPGHGIISKKRTTIVEKKEQGTMAHDSLVTVRLSEAPVLTVDTAVGDRRASRASTIGPSSVEKTAEAVDSSHVGDDKIESGFAEGSEAEVSRNLEDELQECDGQEPATPALENAETVGTDEVNWDELQKTEEQQSKDEDEDSTSLLLARLEQENAKLATNPKSARVRTLDQESSNRPPSMAQLKEMAEQAAPQALRYSVLPPPPMTDLEFYAALVKDYNQTAARLPTLLAHKIRKGIPPPLRGVVWQSMSGARDPALEEQYERLSGESSPHDPAISKDLGRSFPGVDMFRDPDGDGQRMLGRVLKCYSLYDREIGYCQGLAFLVGPLLMHMPDRAAFCVLVRLMDHYDLRSSFQPDLAGLHVRIYQFRELLRQNLPILSAHLEDLQVDPAYVSQWFLSFFAVTCPLPMLFRIYDVLFAEGAPETLMRVALSLMRKNEARILACSELEDAMQLLLSRGLWDCYHYNADEFVDDFIGLSGEVSREKLLQLELRYRDDVNAQRDVALNESSRQINSANGAQTPDVVTTAASRFLGRIWATTRQSSTSRSSASTKTANLSPGLSAPPRPLSMLRRSGSKQSLASTLNSMEASSVSIVSTASTDASSVSRDSSADESTPAQPSKLNSASSKNGEEVRHLHSQIEDLLTALSELQRNQALLQSQLKDEQDNREADREAVRPLLEELRKKASTDSDLTTQSDDTVKPTEEAAPTTATEPSQAIEPTEQAQPGQQQAEGSPPTEQQQQQQGEQPLQEGQPQQEQVVNPYDVYGQQQVQYVNQNQYAYQQPYANAYGYQQPYVNPYDIYNQQQPAVNPYTIGDQPAETTAPSETQDPGTQGGAKEVQAAPLVDGELLQLLDAAEARFGLGEGQGESTASKSHLQEELGKAKEETANALAQSQEYSRRIYELDQEMNTLKESLRESHSLCRTLHQDKQRLEKQIHSMRTRAASAITTPDQIAARDDSNRKSVVGGLREFKLGRSRSSPTQNTTSTFSKRTSSLPQGRESMMFTGAGGAPAGHDDDELLLELVQAKTAEAVAKQEAEEAKQKLEAFRRAHGIPPGENPPATAAQTASAAATQAAQTANAVGQAAMGMLGRFTNGMNENAGKAGTQTPALPATGAPAGGGGGGGSFWGWRK